MSQRSGGNYDDEIKKLKKYLANVNTEGIGNSNGLTTDNYATFANIQRKANSDGYNWSAKEIGYAVTFAKDLVRRFPL